MSYVVREYASDGSVPSHLRSTRCADLKSARAVVKNWFGRGVKRWYCGDLGEVESYHAGRDEGCGGAVISRDVE